MRNPETSILIPEVGANSQALVSQKLHQSNTLHWNILDWNGYVLSDSSRCFYINAGTILLL